MKYDPDEIPQELSDHDYDDNDEYDDDWQPCDNCDGHDACRDFGCAFDFGLGHLVKSDNPFEW